MEYPPAISDQNTRIPAARLHAAYLGLEVYLEHPVTKAKLFGTIEKFSMAFSQTRDAKATVDRITHSDLLVKLRVGGAQVTVPGTTEILLISGGELTTLV